MQAFEVADLVAQQAGSDKPYLEFLKHPALSVGLYVLAAGSVDNQHPHTEDEVYYVVSGRAMFTHAGEEHPVRAGSILYVAAGVEHRFHSIIETLHIIVFFAPAEYSNQKS